MAMAWNNQIENTHLEEGEGVSGDDEDNSKSSITYPNQERLLRNRLVKLWLTPSPVTPSLLFTSMDPSYNQQYGYDVNPYYKPYQGPSFPVPGSSSHSAPVPANAYEYDVGILAQQSVYVPGAMIDKRGGAGGKLAKGGKRTTVLRKGGGKVWEDQTLLEWNPCEHDRFIHYFISMLTTAKHGFVCLLEISATTSLMMF